MRTASFRGVEFNWVEAPRTFGRNTAQHVYPDAVDADGKVTESRAPYVEDPSGKVRTFNMVAVFVGDNCEADADKLVAACETPGPGRLVHPILGELDAICETGTQVIDQTTGEARLELSFVESGRADLAAEQNTSSAVESDTTEVMVRAAARARAILNAVASVPTAVAAGVDAITDGLATVEAAIQASCSPSFASLMRGRLVALGAQATSLAEVPEDIGTAWVDALDGLPPRDALRPVADLAALANANTYGAAVLDIATVAVSAYACEQAVLNPGTADRDATTMAELLVDELTDAAELATTPDQRADLIGMAAVTSNALRAIAGTLPRVQTITLRHPVPLLALVADLFPGQDPETAALAILSRNPTANAMYVPAGTLEVVNA